MEDIFFFFLRLLNYVRPNCIPLRKYIKGTVIKNPYNCIRNKVRHKIDESQYYHLLLMGGHLEHPIRHL